MPDVGPFDGRSVEDWDSEHMLGILGRSRMLQISLFCSSSTDRKFGSRGLFKEAVAELGNGKVTKIRIAAFMAPARPMPLASAGRSRRLRRPSRDEDGFVRYHHGSHRACCSFPWSGDIWSSRGADKERGGADRSRQTSTSVSRTSAVLTEIPVMLLTVPSIHLAAISIRP
jgi:hypothetical protein